MSDPTSISIEDHIQNLINLQQREDEILGKIAELREKENELNYELDGVRKEMRETTESLRTAAAENTAVTPAEETQARLTFLVSDLDGANREISVEGSIFEIGSDERSHVRINDPQVARTAAVIEIRKNDVDPIVTLIDLGCPPCTRVNGNSISKTNLAIEDTVKIGYGAEIKLIKAEFIQGSKPSEEHASPSPFNLKLSSRTKTAGTTQPHRVTGCLT